MRALTKGPQPSELIRWKSDNASQPQNLKYGVASFPKDAVRKSLLIEQFHLCAYTMRRLKTEAECKAGGLDTAASCHIEHILPQSRKVNGEDIDYKNMLACYPPGQSNTVCRYGALAKADFDPDKGDFLSPLLPNVEKHFCFRDDGKVIGRTPTGANTIDILNLNHPTLKNDREAVIKGSLVVKGKKISANAARRLADQVLRADSKQSLSSYCVAIAQAALRHAKQAESKATRIKKKQ